MKFTVQHTDGNARHGIIETAHGQVRTPAFMPVGTAGTVKAIYPEQLRAMGADMVLANCYHLMLRPSAETIAKLGGLHDFMQWDGAILTDSGGFQVMSLAKLCTRTEEGVQFQSHIDGTEYMLTPERSIEIQSLLGADICMVLDECTAYPATQEQAQESMQLSMRWAARCKEAFAKHNNKQNALFGIIQGGVYDALRCESAAALQAIGFDGYAFGGLAVGEGQAAMLGVLDATMPSLPPTCPRYLMGVGTPDDIVESVARGIDMFDCVMPSRAGRHGLAYTAGGTVNLRNARHADDPRPLDEGSPCAAAHQYSRAYLHHLVKSGEYLASMLLTWNNLFFYQQLMAQLRTAIEQGQLATFKESFKQQQAKGDIAPLN